VRSRAISCLSVAGAAGALALPAAASAADSASVVGGTVPTASTPLPAAERTIAPILHDAKAPLVRRDVRLARRLAHVKGEHLPKGYAHELRGWPMDALERHESRLRRAIVRAHREAREERRRRRAAERAARAAAAAAPGSVAPAAGGSTASAPLQAIAACESGGNPSAVGGGGQFRGKYQFTYSTWAAVGGTGDPAAAPEAEQDARAAQLYAQAGAGQWPVCGR
jgi:hypothetical protein